MKYLSQGMESKKKVELLFNLTKITSYNIKQAVYDHLVKNFSIGDAATLNSCQQSNLTHAINALNKIAETVEKVNELNYMSKRI